ncbi:hypothetical protein C8Q74DRAFT_1371382 [Fomes fomentarius]|nr:hypothetical protein C8Q74DRAFT_1371382 [Fomes fomentarius]
MSGGLALIQLDSESGSGEFNLRRHWPIPLYGLALIIHKRYRIWSPRRIPYLTTVRLPEIYGTLALGHFAHIEAGRIVERLNRSGKARPGAGKKQDELDFARKGIALRAFSLRNWVADNPVLLRNLKDVEWCKDLNLKAYDRSYGMLPQRDEDSQHPLLRLLMPPIDYIRWSLRTMWSDEDTRGLVGILLDKQIRRLQLSNHDTGVLVSFIAERVKTRNFHRVRMVAVRILSRFSRLNQSLRGCQPSIAFEDNTYMHLACWTVLAFSFRQIHASRGFTLPSAGLQRLCLYIFAYRMLMGQYSHFSSLWALEDPLKAAQVVENSIADVNERLAKRRAGSAKTTAGTNE